MDNLGAWSGDNLIDSMQTYEGSAYYSELDPLTQFKHGVAKTIRRCLASGNIHKEKISIFILGTCHDITSKLIPRLNSGLTPLSGKVWFVSRQVVSGKGIVFDTNEEADIFEFVISELKSGERPAILFDAKESERSIRFYPNGLLHMDYCEELTIDTQNLCLDEVHKAIEFTHKERFITPDASAHGIKLWEKPDKHWPVDQIERKIQSYLVTGLANWFLACKVKEEQTGVTGRFDVAIVEQDPLDATLKIQHVLLELKVIKSFGSGGVKVYESTNEHWLKSGLEQAHCYREEHKFKFAAICCFDMQVEDNGEKCFNHIKDDANKLSVELWRWYIYNKAKGLRSVETAKALNC